MVKNSPVKKCLSIGAMAFAALCFSHSTFAMSDTERQARLKELKTTIEQLKQELQNVKSNRSELLSDLESSETKISELSKKVKELREKLKDKQSQLDQLHSEKEALVRVKKQQLGSVKQHVSAAYRLGHQSSLKMLLNQQDPAKVARNLKYYDTYLAAQAAKITTYVSTIERLDSIEPDIAAAAVALQQDHASLEQKRQELLTRFADRKRTLEKLETTIANKDVELQTLDKDRQNLEALLQRVVHVVGDLTMPVSNRPFGELKGKLPWPTRGKIINHYGSSRVMGKVRWQGLTIGAEEGSPVYAIHHGRVVFSDYLRGQGLLMIVDHGSGFMSLYAHNQTLYKDIGDWVSAGEQIAAVGQSGGQNSAALYFELRHQGQPTNPQPWLQKSS